jgi:hypothetical protein
VLTITRIDDYLGELTISEGDLLLHREVVGLSYGAIFGPDAADVYEWQRIAIELVDGKKS